MVDIGLVTAAVCVETAQSKKNVAEQAERGMLLISHDFTQNTLGVRGERGRSYRTS